MNEDSQISQITFKFIVVGSTGVGKSSLLLRYIKNQFNNSHYPTIGMQFFSKIIELDSVAVKIQIWDTAGQQTFKSIVKNFYKNSDAVFLVYSIAQKTSFDAIQQWFQQATTNSPEDAIYILIGCQKDLQDQRVISFQEGQQLMKKYGMSFFFQTSAKDDQNIDLAFQQTAKLILINKLSQNKSQPETHNISLRFQDLTETTQGEWNCC